MAADFVALADLLRAPVVAPARSASPEPDLPEAPSGKPIAGDPVPDDISAALRDARLFRARLADAFDDAAARLLRELAADVLARELRLAPCDLGAIVQRIAARAPVVRVRVAPGDVAALTGIAAVADSALDRGDAIVELAGGALDAHLGVRLAVVLEAFA